MRRLNFHNAWRVGALLLTVVAVRLCQGYLSGLVRWVLVSTWLPALLWILVFTLFIAKALWGPAPSEGAPVPVPAWAPTDETWLRLGRFLLMVWSVGFDIGTFGYGGTTSLMLIKSCYLQQTGVKTYFLEFDHVDITTLWIVSSAVFLYVVYRLVMIARDLLFQVAVAESPEPTIVRPEPFGTPTVTIVPQLSEPKPPTDAPH